MEGESCVENGVRREEKAENSSSSCNRSGEYPAVNGMHNGLSSGDKKKEHSSSSGKDKHRDRDRDKHKDRHRDKDKPRDSEHRHSSSNSNSHHRDKEKERSKDGHSSSRDKDKDRSKENRDKDRDKQRDKDKKEHSSSSSSQKDKEKTSSSGSHSKEKHSSSKPHSSSSTSSKDKHVSSPGKDKDKHRSSDKEKDRERDKSKHSSHSDKSKHSSSSNSSSKDKHKDRDKERKHRDREDKPKEEKPVVKEEPRKEPSFPVHLKEEPSSSEGELRIKEEDDDDMDESSFNLQVNDPYRKSLEVKQEVDSEDDVPLVARKSVKRESPSDDEDDVPLTARKKPKKEKDLKRKKKHQSESEDEYSEEEEDDYKPAKKKTSSKPKVSQKSPSKASTQAASQESPTKRKKVKEEEQEVWKWWEEEKKSDGQKWNFLEHKGPVFAPPYERLPDSVKFYYNGKEMKLSEDAEEVATFYGKMLDHDYTTKEAFNKNFFKDWRKTMTPKEREIITDLSKCNFRPMCSYFQQKSEERKAMSKEEKKAIKEKNEELVKEYGFCTIDGHKEKIGNFRIEPPSLFRGRGEHPKMGMLKKRVLPEDVIINCSKDSKFPKPPPGHKWKEVRHDNTVTWLASWTENVQGQVKYVMLNPSSKLKGEKDFQKYEIARKLAHSIEKIRRDYREDWKSKEMRIRQRAVAMYFIDKLALRAGNEKDQEDQADTVGCCSLRVEHIQLFPEKDDKEYVVVFDFLGKDSIRYYNEVPVEKRVFKNLQLFMENKKGSDDLFDRLNTGILNKHLNELMEGLTAKVFRTYNASWTLQQQLEELTNPNYTLPEMILAYNRANRAVAILCNHQRSIPKSHQKSMENLKEKIQTKKEQIQDAEKQYKAAKKEAKHGSAKESIVADKKKKSLEKLKEQLKKLEVLETDREENKTIALGTSKLNYLDPRISVAWCKKYNIPIEKIYNKTQRDKFRWAIDMAGPDYVF